MRWVLAGPVALAAALLAMAGGAVWIPPGRAAVDNLVLPVIAFPLLWSGLFLYACLERRLARAAFVLGALLAGNALLIAWRLAG